MRKQRGPWTLEEARAGFRSIARCHAYALFERQRYPGFTEAGADARALYGIVHKAYLMWQSRIRVAQGRRQRPRHVRWPRR